MRPVPRPKELFPEIAGLGAAKAVRKPSAALPRTSEMQRQRQSAVGSNNAHDLADRHGHGKLLGQSMRAECLPGIAARRKVPVRTLTGFSRSSVSSTTPCTARFNDPRTRSWSVCKAKRADPAGLRWASKPCTAERPDDEQGADAAPRSVNLRRRYRARGPHSGVHRTRP